MTFRQRKLRVTFKLGEGSFGDTGTQEVTLSDLRIAAQVAKAGGPSLGTLSMDVFGMTLSKMNQLSTLGMAPTLLRRNTVVLEAGDDIAGLGTVFVGTITNAYSDMESAPEVPFRVEAHTGLIESVQSAPASSYKGSADVATIMSSLATRMGLKFENTGVTTKISNPNYSGSAMVQMRTCAEDAGINAIADNGTLAIWPAGQSRGGSVPTISPATGLVGYPAYTSKGIVLRTLFNPSIGYGNKIKVQSDLKPACGDWVVFSLNYELDSQVPGGRWFCTIGAARPGLVVVA